MKNIYVLRLKPKYKPKSKVPVFKKYICDIFSGWVESTALIKKAKKFESKKAASEYLKQAWNTVRRQYDIVKVVPRKKKDIKPEEVGYYFIKRNGNIIGYHKDIFDEHDYFVLDLDRKIVRFGDFCLLTEKLHKFIEQEMRKAGVWR